MATATAAHAGSVAADARRAATSATTRTAVPHQSRCVGSANTPVLTQVLCSQLGLRRCSRLLDLALEDQLVVLRNAVRGDARRKDLDEAPTVAGVLMNDTLVIVPCVGRPFRRDSPATSRRAARLKRVTETRDVGEEPQE